MKKLLNNDIWNNAHVLFIFIVVKEATYEKLSSLVESYFLLLFIKQINNLLMHSLVSSPKVLISVVDKNNKYACNAKEESKGKC